MKIKQLKYIITAFLLGLLSIFFGGGIAVNADNNSGYSNAIDDLQKDNNFNVWEYCCLWLFVCLCCGWRASYLPCLFVN